MSAPWKQAFDFYIQEPGGVRELIRVDMAAIDHAPLLSHPNVVQIKLLMHSPEEHGLRSIEETDALGDIEDALVERVSSGLQAIYVGRDMWQGQIDYNFYVPGPLDSPFAQRVRELAVVPDYTTSATWARDPEWRSYRSRYPTPFNQHTMRNRDLQRALEENGDDLSKAREIDHHALFSGKREASGASEALAAAGFRVDRMRRSWRPRGVTLDFHRADRCDGWRPNEISGEILGLLEPFGGYYDGWACMATA